MRKALIVDTPPHGLLAIDGDLQKLGFSCHSTPTAQSAMSLLAGDRSWDLLVTAFQSPGAGLGGRELSRLARTLNGNLRVLYLSETAIAQSSLARNEYCLLLPYTARDLQSAVGEPETATPQAVPGFPRGETIVGQQPTGWRIDPSTRQASKGGVVLGYEVAGEGKLQIKILAGGGDEETNCAIAGDAMAAIDAMMRRSTGKRNLT